MLKISFVLVPFLLLSSAARPQPLGAPLDRTGYIKLLTGWSNTGKLKDAETIATARTMSRYDMWAADVMSFLYANDGDRNAGLAAAAWLDRFVDLVSQRNAVTIQQFPAAGFSLVRVYQALKGSGLLKRSSKDVELAISTATTLGALTTGDIGASMNRGAGTMATLAAVFSLLRADENAPLWKSRFDLGWTNDLLLFKDTNENSCHYNGYWLSLVEEVVEWTGRPAELYRDPQIRRIFYRYLAQIPGTGLMPVYGQGTFAEPTVVLPLQRATKYIKDGTLRWPASLIYHAGQPAVAMQPTNSETAFQMAHMVEMADFSLAPLKPSPGSAFLDHRRAREPDKLILRTGLDRQDAFVLFNLFNQGGHGSFDGSSLTSYQDTGTALLTEVGGEGYEETANLLWIQPADSPWPQRNASAYTARWKFARIGLRHSGGGGSKSLDLTAIANANFRVQGDTDTPDGTLFVDSIRLRSAGRALLIDDFERGIGNWPGKLTTDSAQGKYALAVPLKGEAKANWIPFKPVEPLPRDWSGYDTIEFWYKVSDPRYEISPPTSGLTLQIASELNGYPGAGVFRFADNSSRLLRAVHFQDHGPVVLASLNLDTEVYFGAAHRTRSGPRLDHVRDVALVQGKLLWVRDSVKSQDPIAAQIGPMWHLENVIRKGEGWFLSAPVRGDANLLVCFLPQKGMTASTSFQASNVRDPRGQWWTSQVWRGTSETMLPPLHFNTLLFPVPAGAEPGALRGRIQVLEDSESGTLLRIGEWGGRVSYGAILASPVTSLHGPALSLTGRQAYLEKTGTPEQVVLFACNQVSRLASQGRILIETAGGELVDADADYSRGKESVAWAVNSAAAATLKLFVPFQPGSVAVSGKTAGYRYDAGSGLLELSLPAGKSDILARRGKIDPK